MSHILKHRFVNMCHNEISNKKSLTKIVEKTSKRAKLWGVKIFSSKTSNPWTELDLTNPTTTKLILTQF